MGEDIWGGSSNPASLASIRRKSDEEKKPLDEKPQEQPENLDLAQEELAADDTSEQNSATQNSIEQNSTFTKQNFTPQNSAEQNLAFEAQDSDEENSILRDSIATGSGEQDSKAKSSNSTENAANSQNSTWQNSASSNSDRISSTQSSAKAYDLNKAYVFYMFLGPFGAHRFYLGRIISAIFQLLGGLPFLIWLFLVVVTVMWTSIEGNELLALINSSRPDLGVQASDLKDIEQGFFHFMVIFSVPNVLFLIWLISDFFRLPDMVRKLNVSVGVGDITYLYADDVMECGESLSNAETALYVAFGLEVLSAVSGYIKNADKAGALQGIGIILVICLAVGLYFLARAIRSTDLLSNAAIAGVFSTISALIIVFIGFGLFKPSVFALCISCVCMLVYLIYRLLISKELYDCSGEKDYLRAFYVIAATEMITLVLAILGSQLLVLVSTIGQVVAAVLNVSAVYGTREVAASKGGYDLAHLAYHVRQMNRREF
ncbi:MAG: NINE protein [Campylobacter gracilis]|uniref:NINE protein n=1 Tax=Campylobacter gracilis TaxID=824 RepID=UPI0026E9E60A|nr:NINE protein [Campylobacter gracilis]MBS6153177.1 NINE protein [Campylobacter gracilis]